jgi:hypothetical protein
VQYRGATFPRRGQHARCSSSSRRCSACRSICRTKPTF